MKKYIYFIVALLALAACKKGPEMPMAYIEVDKDYIVVPSFSVNYAISVESNTQWKLSSSATWVTCSVSSGAGNSDLSFSIQDNLGDPRSCVLELVDNVSSLRKEIRIEQNGKNGPDYMPVSTIRKMEATSGSYTFNSGKLKAFVLSNYEAANYKAGQMAVGDSFTAPLSGINIKSCDGFVAYEQGSEVDIDLKGAILSRVDGILTLSLSSRPEQTRTSKVTLTPCEVTYDNLKSGDYESMYVRINNFQVLEEYVGGTFVRCPVLEDEAGNHVQLQVVEEAAFSAELYNRGKGNINGIATGMKSSMPALDPTIVDDAAFTRLRFGAPGVESLPYVFSFLAREDSDNTPKYIIYNELWYNPATQLVQGLVATDEDESIAATLELTAFGTDETKINSGHTHHWAESGGHDNIMCTGFVSQNCKTTPTAECGWWWSVPLKMSLPSKINFSFGLAGTDYSLREWKVSYSKDKKNWRDVESVTIDLSRTGGTFYLYYTVAITLAEPFNSGDTFYVKLTPQGSQSCSGGMGLDGHGSSCQINLHCALVLSEEVEQRTKVPADAVYFQPFDKLTAGMDYFYGEKLAAMTNYSGEEYSAWTSPKKALLDLETKDVYERPGYAQIGFVNEERAGSRTAYNNYVGSLIIPELGQEGDFKLSFKAARYRHPCVDRPGLRTPVADIVNPDIAKGVVRLLPEGTKAYFEETKSATAQFSGMPYDKFKSYSLTIKNATPDTRICFTSAQATTSDFTRWFIDDITVTK